MVWSHLLTHVRATLAFACFIAAPIFFAITSPAVAQPANDFETHDAEPYDAEPYDTEPYDTEPYDFDSGDYVAGDFEPSFDDFDERLAPYGSWLDHPRWGEVWSVEIVDEYRPYYNGRWEYTSEYGWLWVSDDPWGEITDHYGRWVFDPDYGWLWVPGYVWGPSWVVWREGGGQIGWFPMPPGYDAYDSYDYGPRYVADQWYGYRNWYPGFADTSFFSLWVFVGLHDFGHHRYRHHVVDPWRARNYFWRMRDCTNYVTLHDHVVNRSIDLARLPRESRRRIHAQPARNFLGETRVTSITEGRELSRRSRAENRDSLEARRLERRNERSNRRDADPGATPGGDGNIANRIPGRRGAQTVLGGGNVNTGRSELGRGNIGRTNVGRDNVGREPPAGLRRDPAPPASRAGTAATVRGEVLGPAREYRNRGLQAPQGNNNVTRARSAPGPSRSVSASNPAPERRQVQRVQREPRNLGAEARSTRPAAPPRQGRGRSRGGSGE